MYDSIVPKWQNNKNISATHISNVNRTHRNWRYENHFGFFRLRPELPECRLRWCWNKKKIISVLVVFLNVFIKIQFLAFEFINKHHIQKPLSKHTHANVPTRRKKTNSNPRTQNQYCWIFPAAVVHVYVLECKMGEKAACV